MRDGAAPLVAGGRPSLLGHPEGDVVLAQEAHDLLDVCPHADVDELVLNDLPPALVHLGAETQVEVQRAALQTPDAALDIDDGSTTLSLEPGLEVSMKRTRRPLAWSDT